MLGATDSKHRATPATSDGHQPRTSHAPTPTQPLAFTRNDDNLMKTSITSLLLLTLLVACASAPPTFVRNAPGWVSIEVAEGLTKEILWGKVADSLKERDLEFEKIDKDAGYMRTSWNYKISKDKTYSTRVVIDFPSSGKMIRIKTEAQYLSDGDWIEGFDSGFNQTFKDEISAIVGRK
jgi:hypothetical protein